MLGLLNRVCWVGLTCLGLLESGVCWVWLALSCLLGGGCWYWLTGMDKNWLGWFESGACKVGFAHWVKFARLSLLNHICLVWVFGLGLLGGGESCKLGFAGQSLPFGVCWVVFGNSGLLGHVSCVWFARSGFLVQVFWVRFAR